jgi:hypothetical protein
MVHGRGEVKYEERDNIQLGANLHEETLAGGRQP